jgi:acetyltransferase
VHALLGKLGVEGPHQQLARLCFIDYAHEMALIALRMGPTGEQELVGVGRLIMEHERNEAEFALLISDSLQGKGLGTEVLRRLVEIGRIERVGRIVGYILERNWHMLAICRHLGFRNEHEIGDPMVASIIDLA